MDPITEQIDVFECSLTNITKTTVQGYIGTNKSD